MSKNRNEKHDGVPENSEPSNGRKIDKNEESETNYVNIFLPLGTGLGVSFGIIFDQLVMGICLGTALGLIIGGVVETLKKNK